MLIHTPRHGRMLELASRIPFGIERKEDTPNPLVELREQILGKIKEHRDAFEKQIGELKEKGITDPEREKVVGMLIKRMDTLEAELKRPETVLPSILQTVGQKFTDSEEFKHFQKRGWHKGGVSMKLEDLWPGEFKTTITSAAVGSSTPGILIPERVAGIIPKPERRLTIRDLLPSRRTTNNAIEFVRENVFTNAASPAVEGTTKAESALTFVIAYANVRLIAHWIPASRQILDDMEGLRAFIDRRLLYGLKLKEETELLSGDNLGDHLNGLITQATAYAGTYNVAGDTKLDKLRHAILEAEAADEIVTGLVLNPKEVHDIDLIKTEEGGAAKGSYIVGDPLGGVRQVKTFWGKPVVSTNSMPAGKFLLGNFAQQAEVFDRMDATIDVSTEHENYFIKNLVAIRAEERLALAVYRPSAFIYGSI